MRGKLFVVLCVVALGAPAAAIADGDPASDYLPFVKNFVFAPDDGNVPPADVRRLALVVRAARAKSFTTKIALIGTPDDLGADTVLWRKPQVYAEFLGKELFYLYKGRLLVVMPNGYGISAQGGKAVPAEQATLAKIAVPASGIGNLPDAAIGALRTLAKTQNVSLPLPPSTTAKKHDTSTRDRVTIAIAVLVAAGVVVGARLIRRSR